MEKTEQKEVTKAQATEIDGRIERILDTRAKIEPLADAAKHECDVLKAFLLAIECDGYASPVGECVVAHPESREWNETILSTILSPKEMANYCPRTADKKKLGEAMKADPAFAKRIKRALKSTPGTPSLTVRPV